MKDNPVKKFFRCQYVCMGIILLLIGIALAAIGYRVQTEKGPYYGWITVLGVLGMGFGGFQHRCDRACTRDFVPC